MCVAFFNADAHPIKLKEDFKKKKKKENQICELTKITPNM